MKRIALVRYGAVPEVLRCRVDEPSLELDRNTTVIVETPRGVMAGLFLEWAKPSRESHLPAPEPEFQLLRCASREDLNQVEELRQRSLAEIPAWETRVSEWRLELQIIDMDLTFDREKTILYVLNDRGPDCTRLAIQAAAAGLGIIEVQPVSAMGLVALPTKSGGGCGSEGGCGCHH